MLSVIHFAVFGIAVFVLAGRMQRLSDVVEQRAQELV